MLVFVFVIVFCAVCLKLKSKSVGEHGGKPWLLRVVGVSGFPDVV